MRIISGSARGTRLRSLPDPALRPMLDRVKESLFNIVRGEVPGAQVLDLFGGSGSLGLEALSRGADGCVFVEQDARLAQLIRQNADRCHLGERCVIVRADAFALPERTPPQGAVPATLVFCDSPYDLVDDPNRRAELLGLLERLVGTWIDALALLMLHHRPIPYAVWPVQGLEERDKRIYGQSQLTFFRIRQGKHDS